MEGDLKMTNWAVFNDVGLIFAPIVIGAKAAPNSRPNGTFLYRKIYTGVTFCEKVSST
jgi:hypothetical protein